MGLGLGLGIWWPTQTSIIPGLLKALCARATYCENKTCTTATLEEIAAVRYTPPPPPTGILLVDYPGASAAYSLRNLSSTTTNVVRVRRSSDNTEQDFTSAEITDGTLTTFTGANDGFVTTWYDQSGNSNNAVQSTATSQLQLVDDGIVYLENGKPAVFNIPPNFYNSNNLIFNSVLAKTLILVQKTLGQSTSAQINMVVSSFNDNSIRTRSQQWDMTDSSSWWQSLNGEWYSNNLQKTSSYPSSQQELMFLTNINPTVNLRKIGGTVNGRSSIGLWQELILYPSDQSANRTGIETNINTEYTIY